MHPAPHRMIVVALVFGLALAALPAVPPAFASSCPPAGGANIGWAQPEREGDFHVLGRGWGHGVGMSQFGAQGAAELGCTVEEILGTYYPGTRLAQRDDRGIRVGVTFPQGHRSDVRVHAATGPLTWSFNGQAVSPQQPVGALWRVRVQGDRLSLQRAEGADWADVWTAPAPMGRLDVALGSDRRAQLRDKTSARYPFGITYARGTLRFQPRVVGSTLTGHVQPLVLLGSIEEYLYGLDEIIPSWPAAALETQAIAGRSYAHRRAGIQAGCDCHLLDSASNQVYNAYSFEVNSAWVEAVDRTARQVLTYDGQIAETLYSSTHGGQSERVGFSRFFSADAARPYLVPVDDSRWELASDSDRRGVRRWAVTYSREQVTERINEWLAANNRQQVGAVQSVHVRAPTGAGGRVGVPERQVPGSGGTHYGGVEVIGTAGTARLSGLHFVQALDVPRRSELFRVETGAAFQCLPTTSQEGNLTVRRSAGPHRVGTAAAVSEQHWEEASDVVLATSINFPDALSAGVLAARLDAPILLTRGSELDGEALRELQRLSPERVHLMGGTAALSERVQEQVEAAGFEAIRVAGPNRFATARAAALAAGASETGEVALAFGGDWPDAVSAGALSGGPDRVPVLLSERTSVPDETLDALRELEAGTVLLIGGTAVLDQAVVAQLQAEGYEVRRLSGPSRYETSLAVAGDAAGRADGERPVVLATGQQFPDALSAGGLVARLEAGLVLTTRCDMRGQIEATFGHIEAGPYDRGVIVGGLAAVSDLVREQATTAITNGS